MRSRSLLLFTALLCAPACLVSVDDPPAGGQYRCDGSGQCPAGLTCDTASGLCRGDRTRALGASCTGPEGCDSGECVEGICCASACPEQPASDCGRTGACSPDGMSCELWERGTACTEAACASGMFLAAASCDGAGECMVGEQQPCPGDFGCLDATNCRADCATDTDCAPGFFCHADASGAPKVCRKRNVGESCSAHGDCASDACVGGYCCAQRCADQGAASCGQTGACELSNPGSANYGHCAFYPAGTACRAQSCDPVTDYLTTSANCGGDGQPCPSAQPAPCPGGVECENALRCVGSCLVGTKDGCTDGKWCRQAADGTLSCQLNSQAPGEPCDRTTDCAQGTCNNGICCAQAPCCRSRADCAPDTHRCANVASCVNEDLLYACTAFACVQTADPVTNSCAGLLASSCNSFVDAVCPTTACPPGCTVNSQPNDRLCDPGYYCTTSSTCQPKKDDQVGCSSDRECKDGTCRLGYCCGDQLECCAEAGTCTAECTSPLTCQGYARTCDRGNCVTTSTPNDSGCNYALSTSHSFSCSDKTLYIHCNGEIDQKPSALCAAGCAVVGENSCEENPNVNCGVGLKCVGGTLASQCTNSHCSCARRSNNTCLMDTCFSGKRCVGATISNDCFGVCL